MQLQIDKTSLERQSGTLGCVRFRGGHTYDKIAEILDDVRREFLIDETKIIATITDNGSNFVKSFKEFGIDVAPYTEYTEEEDKEDKRDNENANQENQTVEDEEDSLFMNSTVGRSADDSIELPYHLRCCSHTLCLVSTTDAKTALKGSYAKLHHTTMGKCSALWNAAGRPKSAEVIKNVIGCQLRLPCVTRWNSLYDSLKLLQKHRHILNDLMSQLGLPTFKEVELEFLDEYIDVLNPIATALDRLQADKQCFYGCMLPTLLAVEKRLERLNSTHLRHCQPLLDSVTEGFKKRYNKYLNLDKISTFDNDCVMAILSSSSNPQIKLKWLTIKLDYNTSKMKKTVQGMLTSAVKAVESSDPSAINRNDDDSQNKNSEESADEFFEFENSPSDETSKQNTQEMEVLKFLSDESTSTKSLEQYPGVRQVFVKYNTPLPSSAPVERLFSYAGHIHSPKRNRLSDKMFSQLVFLKGNEL